MPNIPSAAGIFIPGFLNTTNTASPSGQGDPYGNIYPSGLTPGKVVMLAPGEAASLAAPGTKLFDGAYQFILLDSGATAANAVAGQPAFIRLDSGPTVGALPETDYENGSVTTWDQVANQSNAQLFAGVFINPATLQGQANTPTPGNYTFIFVGAGRVQCTVTSTTGTPAPGDLVVPNGSSAGFNTQNIGGGTGASAILGGIGFAVNTASTTNGVVAYCRNLFYRVFNQGV